MLHSEAVDATTLELIELLQGKDYLTDSNKVLSEKDICAMKLNAIAICGQRVKDFIDIWYLLRKFEVNEILGFYKTKYNQSNDAVILKSLLFFDDVDVADWPLLIRNPSLKWATVKKDIEKKVLHYIKGK
jgi:hypothetical protein